MARAWITHRPRRHRLPTISAMMSNSRRVLAIVTTSAALGAGVGAGVAIGGPLDVDPDAAMDVDWQDQPCLWADHQRALGQYSDQVDQLPDRDAIEIVDRCGQ